MSKSMEAMIIIVGIWTSIYAIFIIINYLEPDNIHDKDRDPRDDI